MTPKTDVWQGTLALMILKTLETLYPQLMKLEQEGAIAGDWGVSENGRRARFYRLTRAGRRRLARATAEWEEATAILDRFLAPGESQ